MATNPEEVGRLDNLYERGIKNDVPDLKIVGPEEIKEIEPNCVVSFCCCTLYFYIEVTFLKCLKIEAINS